jgi:hypothetical protein
LAGRRSICLIKQVGATFKKAEKFKGMLPEPSIARIEDAFQIHFLYLTCLPNGLRLRFGFKYLQEKRRIKDDNN